MGWAGHSVFVQPGCGMAVVQGGQGMVYSLDMAVVGLLFGVGRLGCSPSLIAVLILCRIGRYKTLIWPICGTTPVGGVWGAVCLPGLVLAWLLHSVDGAAVPPLPACGTAIANGRQGVFHSSGWAVYGYCMGREGHVAGPQARGRTPKTVPIRLRLQNDAHQCNYPLRKSLQVPAFLTSVVGLVCGLAAFQTVAFLLDLRASRSVHESFKSGYSIPFNSMISLELIPIDFQNQAFWGLIFLLQTQWWGVRCGV